MIKHIISGIIIIALIIFMIFIFNTANDKIDIAEEYCEGELGGELKGRNIRSIKCYVEEGGSIVKYELIKFKDNWRILK